jgi:hypothetical protein
MLARWAVELAAWKGEADDRAAWRVVLPALPQQEWGGDACGAYALMNATAAALGEQAPPLPPGARDKDLRHAIAHMLVTGRLV